ncbi:MAG: hypothetical protein AB7I32_05380 [Gammaproteobacteria bacterium]
MPIDRDRTDTLPELQRELNALYGLVHYARERCYPETLTAYLESLIAATTAEADRRRTA